MVGVDTVVSVASGQSLCQVFPAGEPRCDASEVFAASGSCRRKSWVNKQRRSVIFFKLIWNICLFSSSSSIKISSLKICSHQDLDIFLMLRWRLVSSSRRFWIHQTSQFSKCGKMDGDPLIRLAKSFSKLCGYLPQKLHKNNMYICTYVFVHTYLYICIYIPFNCSVIE